VNIVYVNCATDGGARRRCVAAARPRAAAIGPLITGLEVNLSRAENFKTRIGVLTGSAILLVHHLLLGVLFESSAQDSDTNNFLCRGVG
jgi:hypothetical protein